MRSDGVRRFRVDFGVSSEGIAEAHDEPLRVGASKVGGSGTVATRPCATIFKIAAVSRHKLTDVLAGYVRLVDLFKDHTGAAFL